MKHILTFYLIVFFSMPAAAGSFLKYGELQIKNYDEMETIVQQHLKKAQKLDRKSRTGCNPSATEELRTALKLIFSRPNKDNMVSKLLPDVRRELKSCDSYDETVSSLVDEAIRGVQSKSLATTYKSTYLFVLENIMSEFKPQIRDKAPVRSWFTKIRDAKIKVPDDVTNDWRLNAMLPAFDPSPVAAEVLKASAKKKR